jgi:hypothetical protein
MKKFNQQKLSVIFLGSILSLSACGGGGSSAVSTLEIPNATGSSLLVSTATASAVSPPLNISAGDYWVYKTKATRVNQSTLTNETLQDFTSMAFVKLAGQGLEVITTSSASDVVALDRYFGTVTTSRFDLKGNKLTAAEQFTDIVYSSGRRGSVTSCGYVPALQVYPVLAATNTSVTSASQVGCDKVETGSTASTPNFSTAINRLMFLDYEQVTTPAGIFRAFKFTKESEETDERDIVTRTENVWLDEKTGYTIKRQGRVISREIATGKTNTDASYISEVAEFVTAAGGKFAPSRAKFAGAWELSAQGTGGQNCWFIVNTSSALRGECYFGKQVSGDATLPLFPGSPPSPPATVTRAITGTVGLDGTLAFSLSDGTSYSGNLSNPVSGSGTWRTGGINGTWTASHR